MLDEAELFPYFSSRLFGKKILVLAPHPDDETFGCGGSIILQRDNHGDVKIIFLTNGSKGGSREKARDEYVASRRMEAEKACAHLGVADLEFWFYEDRELGNAEDATSKIIDLLHAYKPELVLVPSPLEIHPDHRATAHFFEKSIRKEPFNCKVAFYEIGQPLPAVNCLVNITPVLERKMQAVSEYKSQLLERPYDDFSFSLGRYRSFTLPPSQTHAEAFYTCGSEEIHEQGALAVLLKDITKRGQVFDIEQDFQFSKLDMHSKEQTYKNNSRQQPFISVVLPTYNRPKELAKSLKSIFDQTFQDFEVIVVNDGGEDVQKVIDSFEQKEKIVYLAHSRNRGVAAARNTAIRKSGGRFIAYLDDDDIYYPDHLRAAAEVLAGGEYKIVYTTSHEAVETWVTDRYVTIDKRVAFDFDFDRSKLLVGNYIPTLTIIHEKSILDETGLFDETLKVHEDWDLWIRFSQKYAFYHIDRITASYTTRLPHASLRMDRRAFLASAKKIHSRYNHLISDPQLLEAQEKALKAFQREIEDARPGAISADYLRLHQYYFVTPFVRGKKVLVVEYGKGDGCCLLAEDAASVTGVSADISWTANAPFTCIRENLFFEQTGAPYDLPNTEHPFEVIIAFNIALDRKGLNFKKWISDAKELMTPDGTMVLSFALKNDSGSANERDRGEVVSLLKASFDSVQQFGQVLLSGSTIFSVQNANRSGEEILIESINEEYVHCGIERKRSRELIILATNDAEMSLERLNSYCLDLSNSLINSYHSNTRRLRLESRKDGLHFEEAIGSKDRHIRNLEESLRHEKQLAVNLKTVVESKDEHILNLKAIIEDKDKSNQRAVQLKDQHIENLQRIVSSLEKERQNTTESLERLKEEYEQMQTQVFHIKAELELIKASKVWRTAEFFRKWFYDRLLAPFPLLRKGFLSVSSQGFKCTLQNTIHYFRRTKNLPSMGLKSNYDIWIEKNRLSEAHLETIRTALSSFAYQPLISILMPVYNVDREWLTKAIDSVRNQVYPNWELCIVDDASIKPHVKEVLNFFTGLDGRIRVRYLSANLGISGASNEALKHATGEFIGLLDNDDELTPEALYECVKLLNAHSDADLIYSDEDKLDIDGKRMEPFFKPDFSLDLLLSMNYICHFSLLRTAIVDRIGGFREGYEGSQDYDLLLRFIEETEPQKIHHIPKILYHWRKIPGSAAAEVNAKDYAFISAKKALDDYRERNRIPGNIMDGLFLGSYRLKREIVDPEKVSILIPFRDRPDLLRICLESIFEKTTYPAYEILLINNRSTGKETFDYLDSIREKSEIRILDYDHDFNFSAINNFAASQAKGEYILLLNNDVKVISADWLSAMVEHAQRPEVGVVGAKLLFRDGRIQHAGVVMGIGIASHAFSHSPGNENGYFGLINVVRNYCAVTGACMMLRKEVYEDLGGLDEVKLSVAYNDVDLCLKAVDKRYLVVYTPYALLYHYESETRGDDNDFNLKQKDPSKYLRVMAEREFMHQKWTKYIENDPFYNPNLTRARNDFGIRIE